MSAKHMRRKYLIDKGFQVWFILKFCSIVLAASLIIGAVVFAVNQNSTTVAIENTRVVVKTTADFILPMLLLTVLVVAAVSAGIVAFMGLMTTHRIVGPLYRLRREIEGLQDGDFTRTFAVRNKDHLKELARGLAAMNEKLRVKHGELKKKAEALNTFLKEKNYCISFEDRDRFAQMLKEMEGLMEFFKV